MWSNLWNPKHTRPEEVQELIDAMEDLRSQAGESSPINVSMDLFMHTLKTYHKDSKGADNWQVSELQSLPVSILNMFHTFLNF